MTKGYFPDRVIPPVNSLALSAAITDILAYIRPKATNILNRVKDAAFPRGRCVTQSVPKRKHSRRTLSIPNPLHQSVLADEIATNWHDLESFCAKSPISLSAPIKGTDRALQAKHDLSKQPLFRVQQSVGARYLLTTDIARYYPSIYTHSIPWALHGKTQARSDKKYKLTGNRLDLWLRETQDKQTGGIPIGSDSSFLIGEILGTALDMELQSKLPSLRGARSIDDYYLYFATQSDAERGLAAFHEVARQFELEINDSKTEIIQLPERLEPPWKSDLRRLIIRESGQAQATDLLTLFDNAFQHAQKFPSDSVLTYAAKQTLTANITEENWGFCEGLLLKAALAEPSMLSVLVDLYEKYAAYHTGNDALSATIESICSYHAPLQQGNEVAWALWLAKKMNISIQKTVGDRIARLDDDVVALIALDMNNLGLLDASGFTKWRSYMTAGNLYENHWLIAYEALEQGWLPSKSGSDYIESDDFFSILRSNNVRFYGAAIVDTASFFEYDADEDDLSGDGDDEELLIEEDDEPSDNSDHDELLTE
ncbi:MAG TPA: RNA-directed DNA polymerase [Candidatus Angelobacter sp.]